MARTNVRAIKAAKMIDEVLAALVVKEDGKTQLNECPMHVRSYTLEYYLRDVELSDETKALKFAKERIARHNCANVKQAIACYNS